MGSIRAFLLVFRRNSLSMDKYMSIERRSI